MKKMIIGSETGNNIEKLSPQEYAERFDFRISDIEKWYGNGNLDTIAAMYICDDNDKYTGVEYTDGTYMLFDDDESEWSVTYSKMIDKLSGAKSRKQNSSIKTWQGIQNSLEEDCEDGIDPLYEMTKAGNALTSICHDIESELNVCIEPSIQAGVGSVSIYSTDDDSTLAEDVDYQDFNDAIIDMALDANSEKEFKSKYKAYLKNLI